MKYTRLGDEDFAPRGGMVDTPARTPQGFALLLRNALYRAGSWVWRPAIKKLHSVAYSDYLTWVDADKSTSARGTTWTMLAATAGASVDRAVFLKLDGNSFVMIPYNGTPGPVGNDPSNRWRAWRAVAPTTGGPIRYACRRCRENGVLYNVNYQTNQATLSGIAAPTAAPAVIDSAGAGVLPAGSYPVAYRFRTSDGMYSPWSPTAVAVIALNKKRAWTIQTSPHPRVVARELGVGFAGGDERNVYVAYDLEDNTTTTIEEEVLEDDYDIDRAANFDLGLPPASPEEVRKWDGRLWILSNSPNSLLWPSAIDNQGAVWELFDPNQALAPPDRGAERWQAFVPWDTGRAAAITNTALYQVRPGAGENYTLELLDDAHGCVSAAAADVGAGMIGFFDGRNFVVSRGGACEIVSRGEVEAILATVPDAYAEKAIVKYTPEDGGMFLLSIPSTAASTECDLVLAWKPNEGWHVRTLLGGTKAPWFIGLIQSSEAAQYTVCTFPTEFSVYRWDAPERRDAGSLNIPVRIQTAPIYPPKGYGAVAVARVHVGIRRRVDYGLLDSAATVSCDVSLSLNHGKATTNTVSATLVAGTDFLHARAQNLEQPAENVSIILDFDHPDLMEVFSVKPEVVFYKRDEGRA